MKFNNKPLVDAKSILPYYAQKNIIADLLKKCNGQELRYIDGYGRGYFLSTENIPVSTETVKVDYGVKAIDVAILDKLSLEYPTQTGTILYCYLTGEAKCLLEEDLVIRSYNVIVPHTITRYDQPLAFETQEDECDPLTLEEVMEDILDQAGYALEYDAQEIISYDIAVEGMSILQAFDHLCSIYGLVWTFIKSTDTVHVWKLEEPSLTAPHNPPYNDKMNNIHSTKFRPNVSDISVVFPIYDYRRKTPEEFQWETANSSDAGYKLTTYDPYLFAHFNSADEPRNEPQLEDRRNLIKENIRNIYLTLFLLEKHHFEIPLQKPVSLSEIYGDWGYGPRTILRWIDYPIFPVPPYKPNARVARNWRGQLSHTYYTAEDAEPVEYFVVAPIVAFDGDLPPSPQRVENIYGWDYGEEGWPVRVEWNPVNNKWEAIQQWYRCPPDDAENEPPPEYETMERCEE